MTVAELIEVLRTLPQDADVWADEGEAVANPVVGAGVDWVGDVTIRVMD